MSSKCIYDNYTSAIINPFSKSECILPAAWGALVPLEREQLGFLDFFEGVI